MVAKGRPQTTDSHKVEVGEIDTSAPFQSVKDAVTLFGKGALSGEKISKSLIRNAGPHSAERVLAKDTQFHLAQKELNKLKEQLQNVETTKTQALLELELAKATIEDLTHKLKTASELKELAIKATEESNNQIEKHEEANYDNTEGKLGSWKHDLEAAREQYMIAASELDASKQELTKIRQDHNSSIDTKLAAIEQAKVAENAAKANMEKASEISKEISGLHLSIEQVRLAAMQAHQEQGNIYAEKDVEKQHHKAKLEDSTKKLLTLKKEFDPEFIKNLDAQLANTGTEIDALQKKIEGAKASDLDSVRTVTFELGGAKDSLQKVAEEEVSLQNLLESLKLELVKVKKEREALKEKQAETETIAGDLNVKLCKSKLELETCLAEECKVADASNEMISTLRQLSSETEEAREEAEEMKIRAEEMKKEAEATKIELEEAEATLKVALEEAEEAKTAELKAIEQIKLLSEKTSASRSSVSESGAKITMSKDELESLSRKVQESEMLAELKVGAAMAQVEAIKASENEALQKLEASRKEIEEMKAATQQALKRADSAEAAKRAVEGELRRWYEREQKKAAEAASLILAETQVVSETSSPVHYETHKPELTGKIVEARKYNKATTFVTKKKSLLPSLSGIFSRKRNQIEGGSPSYLPGEKSF